MHRATTDRSDRQYLAITKYEFTFNNCGKHRRTRRVATGGGPNEIWSHVRSFVRSFVRWFVRSLVGSFVGSFAYSLPRISAKFRFTLRDRHYSTQPATTFYSLQHAANLCFPLSSSAEINARRVPKLFVLHPFPPPTSL